MSTSPATVDDVIELAPELATVNSVQLGIIVNSIALEALSVATWGELFTDGHRTLAAHIATTLFNTAANGGAVTSRRIDKIQVSYSSGQFSDVELSQTSYGRMHMMLRDRLVNSASFGDADRGWTVDGDPTLIP